MVALTAIYDWVGAPGSVVSWAPSADCTARVAQAPASDVPPSYQQEQHIRAYRAHRADGLEMARLMIPSWKIPGRCDIRAMTYVINAYLRRHDTYQSWFEFDEADRVVRRSLANPADIKLVPTDRGEMTSTQWQAEALDVPGPLSWDCFRFGVIQRADHFTFYASIDHLHADAMFVVAMFVDIHQNYSAVVEGAVPIRLPAAGSYLDYCVRQREYTNGLTLESPEVVEWLEFLRRNGGTLPKFPMPLGDAGVPYTGELVKIRLMDVRESDRFESVCASAGARFIGGAFACAALAERELTGVENYNVITPTTTRRTPAEFATTGWFTGVVPISIPVAGKSFAEIARASQEAFDSGMKLANVPIERVYELAASLPDIRTAEPGVPMLSYFDTGLPPLDPVVMAQWQKQEGTLYTGVGAVNQIGMWVNRGTDGTVISVGYPDNPAARESSNQYVELMKMFYLRAVDGRPDSLSSPRIPRAAV